MFGLFGRSKKDNKHTNAVPQESNAVELKESQTIFSPNKTEVDKACKALNDIQLSEKNNNSGRKINAILEKVDSWFAHWEVDEIVRFFHHMTTLWDPVLFINNYWQAQILLKLIKLDQQTSVSADPSNPEDTELKVITVRTFKLFDEHNYFSLLFRPLFKELTIKKLYYYLLSNASEIDQSDLRRTFEKERHLFMHTLLMTFDLGKVSSNRLLAFTQWDRKLFFEIFNHLSLDEKRKIWTFLASESLIDQSAENIVIFFSECIQSAGENDEVHGFEFLSFLKEIHPYIKNNLALRRELLKSCESKYISGLLNPEQIAQDELSSYFLVWNLAKTAAFTPENITKNYSFFLKLRQVEEGIFKTILGNAMIHYQETESSLAHRLIQEHTTARGKHLQHVPGLLDRRTKFEQDVMRAIIQPITSLDRSKGIPDAIYTIPAFLLEPFIADSPRTFSHASSSSSFFEDSEKAGFRQVSSHSTLSTESSAALSPVVSQRKTSSPLQLIDEAMFPERLIARTFTTVLKNGLSSTQTVSEQSDYKSKIQSRTTKVEPINATRVLLKTLVEDVLAGNEWAGCKKAGKLKKLVGNDFVTIDYQANYGELFKDSFGSEKNGETIQGFSRSISAPVSAIDFSQLVPRLQETVKRLSRVLETETAVTPELKTMFVDAICQLGTLAIVGQFDKNLATELAGLCLRLPLDTRDELLRECACVQEFTQIQELSITLEQRINQRLDQSAQELSNDECNQLQRDVISFKNACDSIKTKYPVLRDVPLMRNLKEKSDYFEEQEAKIRKVDYDDSFLASWFKK